MRRRGYVGVYNGVVGLRGFSRSLTLGRICVLDTAAVHAVWCEVMAGVGVSLSQERAMRMRGEALLVGPPQARRTRPRGWRPGGRVFAAACAPNGDTGGAEKMCVFGGQRSLLTRNGRPLIRAGTAGRKGWYTVCVMGCFVVECLAGFLRLKTLTALAHTTWASRGYESWHFVSADE